LIIACDVLHECGGHVKRIESTGNPENPLIFTPDKEM